MLKRLAGDGRRSHGRGHCVVMDKNGPLRWRPPGQSEAVFARWEIVRERLEVNRGTKIRRPHGQTLGGCAFTPRSGIEIYDCRRIGRNELDSRCSIMNRK